MAAPNKTEVRQGTEAAQSPFDGLPDSIILEGHEPSPYPPGVDRSKVKVLGFDDFRAAAITLGAYDPASEAMNMRHSLSVMSAKKLAVNPDASQAMRDDATKMLTELQRVLNKE